MFPVGYCFLCGYAVECTVYFHGVKFGRIVVQVVFGSCFVRIKSVFPEIVAKPNCAQKQVWHVIIFLSTKANFYHQPVLASQECSVL